MQTDRQTEQCLLSSWLLDLRSQSDCFPEETFSIEKIDHSENIQ